ncbi:General transcription factor II-I repeat domain-containing protein 2, partial [Stegodyphus mimosarum]
METKGKSVTEFEDEDWVVDLTEHLNNLNLRLQGKNQLINNMFQTITAFERKLQFWHNQIKVNDVTYFNTLAAHKPVSCIKYIKYAAFIFGLIQEFENRFQDFRKNEASTYFLPLFLWK